jgi:secondary thiamine-phosphate synthase enzyme
MKLHSNSETYSTSGRSTLDITADLQLSVRSAGVESGLVTVFIHHTSASLILCENADPDVQDDLERWFSGAVVDGDRRFVHRHEGDDDMSGHIRSILTGSTLQIPVANGRADLGTWQGVYLWEHRYEPHRRRVTTTVLGT